MLHIGVLGYSQQHGIRLLKEIIKNEQETEPSKIQLDKVVLKDNTCYKVIINNNRDAVKGMRFDQLIIPELDVVASQFFQENIKPCLAGSCVPNEFLIQVYKEQE